MRIFTLIIIICLLPLSAYSLEPMNDGDMDQVTGRFGTSAAGDAGALTAPITDVSSNAGNISPAAEPTSIGVNAILDGAYANDRSDDITKMTTYFVNTGDVVRAPGLGFF